MSVYDKIFPPKLLTLPNGKQVRKPRSRALDRRRTPDRQCRL